MTTTKTTKPRKATTQPKGAATPKRPKKAATPKTPSALAELDFEQLEEELLSASAELGDDSPIGPDGEIRPVVLGKKGKSGPKTQHVFTADGVDYFIPKHPSPAIMIKFLQEARDKRIGVDLAVVNAQLTLLGQDALDALAGSRDADEEDVAKVFEIVAYTLFGAIKKWRQAAAPSSAG